MCGIVGYTGHRSALEVLLDGLERLEYRGYDSAGVVVQENGSLQVYKKKGHLAVLKESLNGCSLKAIGGSKLGSAGGSLVNGAATTGIGHTRWATHGKPSDVNAHPHIDCEGRIAVVHNGIIENYLELREWLESEGHVFKSETDTEVLPHLIEHFYKGDLLQAVREMMARVSGSYAIVVMNREEPGRLLAARQDSPMVIGLGERENFVASDIPALLKYTRRTYLLSNGEIADIVPGQIRVYNKGGKTLVKEVHEVKWEAEQAEKGGYEHFMLKEIFEQPEAIRDTLKGRISPDGRSVTLEKELNLTTQEIKSLNKIFMVACGTAYHAGLIGKYFIEKLARIPVEVDIASEFRYREPILGPNALVVVISQSGETADTLAGLREAKARGVRVAAVTNVVGSSVAREADDVMYTRAGPEIAVASTKAYVTQLIAMYLLGIYLARKKGTIDEKIAGELITGIRELPGKAQEILDNAGVVEECARQYAGCENIFFIGRGMDHAVACEGALKLKEISYIHAEAYAAGELKHGTLALVVEGVPVVALATQPALYEKIVSNIKEVNARNASVIALATRGYSDIEKVSNRVIYVPETHPLLAAVPAVIPLQLLAYYAAVARGCDVDKPRNLAKSVTVE